MDNDIILSATVVPENLCGQCGRLFKTPNALRSHMQVHRVVQAEAEELAAPDESHPESFTTAPEAKILPIAVKIVKLAHYGDLPNIARATEGSAGYDLFAAIPRNICIGVGERAPIPTGLCIEIPSSMYALIAPRSGLACNKGVTVVNAPGVIDSDYRGEIVCHLVNHSNTKFWVEPGMRIAQMIFHNYVAPEIVVVDQLSDTLRGTGGFGSTGV